MDTLAYILLAIVITILFKVYNHRKNIKNLRIALNKQFGKKPKAQRYDIEDLGHYWNEYKKSLPDDEMIDEITWNDLEMDKLFCRINNCSSFPGEQVLYSMLHCLPKDKLYAESLEERIKFFLNNDNERLEMQLLLLTSLGKDRASYFIPNFISDIDTFEIKGIWKYRVMQGLLFLFILLAVIFQSQSFVLLSSIVFIINIIVYSKQKFKYENYLEALGYIAAIISFGKKVANSKVLSYESKFNDLKERAGVFKKLSYNIINVTSKKNAVTSGDLFAILYDYIMGATLIDFIRYDQIMRVLKNKEKEFMDLYKRIGMIDMAITIGSFRRSLPHYCTPLLNKDKMLQIQDIYHPLIDDPVVNTVTLDGNCIITGSNASGKSTFIKAVAVNVILAQSLNTCMAKKMALPFSRVITSMAVTDDLMSGESYYIKEIKYLNRIIKSLSDERFVICVIDEILRGTNTEERIAASASILKYIHKKNCLAIVATHDIELTSILGSLYKNFHFREQMQDKDITFDYMIHDGVSKSRNAIKLLKYVGFPDEIINEAEGFDVNLLHENRNIPTGR
ncbi:MAG: hypothetical protein PHC69_06240 [Ruminiclostridium sp.]|nr:hypothetical protein [Ruminiclostridium sp.]